LVVIPTVVVETQPLTRMEKSRRSAVRDARGIEAGSIDEWRMTSGNNEAALMD
jgi:hypothetical protein